MGKLPLKVDDNKQSDFSDKEVCTTEQTIKFKNMDPSKLIKVFLRKHFDIERTRAAKFVLDKLRRVSVITCEQSNEWFASYFNIKDNTKAIC